MNKTRELVLLGGGGHCKSVIESIELEGNYTIAGISEQPSRKGEKISGYNVFTTDDEIEVLAKEGYSFLITVGQIRNPMPRKLLFEKLKSCNAKIATITDPTAVVSPRSVIGEGSVVLRHTFVNAGAVIGTNCIINTSAIVEHDSIIGNNVHISTRAIVNGDCKIGDNCFIGSGAIIINGVSICSDTLIGASAVVFRSITKPGTYMGNPARMVK